MWLPLLGYPEFDHQCLKELKNTVPIHLLARQIIFFLPWQKILK